MAKNTEKNYAPTIKLYPGYKEGTFNANVNDNTLTIIEDLISRVEKGGRIALRPVSEAYKAKAKEANPDNAAPELELTVYTAAEVEGFKAWGKAQKGEQATGTDSI